MTTYVVGSLCYVAMGIVLPILKRMPLPGGDSPWLDRLLPWFEDQNPTFGGHILASWMTAGLLLITVPWDLLGTGAGLTSLVIVLGGTSVVTARLFRASTYTISDLTGTIEWDALSPRTGRLLAIGVMVVYVGLVVAILT